MILHLAFFFFLFFSFFLFSPCGEQGVSGETAEILREAAQDRDILTSKCQRLEERATQQVKKNERKRKKGKGKGERRHLFPFFR